MFDLEPQESENADLLSVSENLDVSKVLAPIQLKDKEQDDYEYILFPNRSKNSYGLKASVYGELATQLVDLSLQLNNMRRILAYIVTTGGRLEDLEPEGFEQAIRNRVATMQSGVDVGMKTEITKQLLGAMGNGQYHVIRNSDRYTGGKDIVFSGIPNKSSADSAVGSGVVVKVSSVDTSASSKPGSFYDNLKMEHYETEPAQKALKALDELNQFIFKKALSVENATGWHQAQLRLDTDFSAIDQIFARAFGFNLELFEPLEIHEVMGKYISLLVMVAPPKEIVEEYSGYFNRKKYKDENPDSEIDVEPPSLESIYTEEAAKVNREYAVSIALNLPKSFVDYISQNDQGELNNYCLSSWVIQWSRAYLRPKGARSTTGRVRYQRLARYVVPASKNDILISHRKESGYEVDQGRVNEDRITVSPRGTLTFLPRTDDKNFTNAADYEQVMEKTLEASYSAGAPLTDSQTMLSRVFAVDQGDYRIEESVAAQKKQLDRFKGTLLSLNWDYNVSLNAGTSSSFSQFANDLNGSTSPSPLALGDYLGYDFAQEGERDQRKTFLASMNYLMPGKDFSELDEKNNATKTDREYQLATNRGITFLHNNDFQKLLKTYTFLLRKDKVRGIQELVTESMKELDIESLPTSKLDVSLYSNLEDDGKIKGDYTGNEHRFVTEVLFEALSDAKGISGSNLFRMVADEVGYENAALEVKEAPQHFDAGTSTMADFGNVYSYLGGLVFKKVCEEITKADSEALLIPLEQFDDSINGYSIPFDDISKIVMPLAFMFSKYVPNAENIMEQAEAEAESYEMDDGVAVDDIQAPGIAPGSQVFPHQIKAHKYLRGKPKFAVLDISPGGGKTITLILDIMAIVGELQGEGIKPLVIAPDKLVANWCNDLIKVTKGAWNAIPLTAESLQSWGEEKLTELVNTAPPNTIFFTGINFLKSKAQEISFGPRKLKIYGGTEFIKKFGFNYVALDESHKAKKFDPKAGSTSIVHSTVKQVFTHPSVKYARLATGTLIHGLLKDVVGQAALFSSHIFRTPDDFEIDASAVDGAIRVRSKFGEHASVITIKRKEWAFMLPSPIDTFLEVNLLDENSTLHEETLMQVYNALLQQTIDELQDHVNKAKANADSSDSESDAGLEGDEDPDFDEDEELGQIDQNAFRYYMQRLEQMLVDPWGDEAFEDAAVKAGIPRTFVSPKVEAIVERLDRHFAVEKYDPSNTTNRIVKWELGMEARELDVVEHMGQYYMRRRMDDGIVTPKRRKTPASQLSPDQDNENWKLEQRGKVIIFTRYTRSVDAIFDALPAKYKSSAVKFHGQVKGKWENLEAFKNDPDIQIIVANEQAISEGHNLQMASRIIRVETPWSPGEYEQSTARIFRPDPSAAQVENGKPGDMKREVIYIDWLMCKGTLEVAKVARLMWKTVEKTKFDEKGNPLYDDIMETSLGKINMSIKTLISAATDGFDSFRDHFQAKADLNAIESAEFHDMRKTTIASMQDLPVTEPLPSFRTMEAVPILENQNIPDPQGHGLTKFLDWWGEYTATNFKNDHATMDQLTKDDLMKILKGLPVKTEFGTGVIVGWTKINMATKPDGTEHIHYKVPVTGIKVRFNANDEIANIKPRKLFVAADVSKDDFDKFFSTNKPWATEAERKAIEKTQAEAEKKAEKEKKAAQKRKTKVSKRVEAEGNVKAKARKRRDNVKRGKPINDGIDRVVKDKMEPVLDGQDLKVNKDGELVPDMDIKMHVSVFNGFMALHVNAADPDAKELKKLGFKGFGEYAYAEFLTYKHFEKALDYIDDTFHIDAPTARRLGAANDAFDDYQRMGFNMRLAAKVQKDLPLFFRANLRASQDKKTIKMYPVVMDDRLRLVVDLKTSPRMRRYLNKQMPGAGRYGKWKLHEGMSIFFALNKTSAKAKIKELKKAGYNITNLDEVLKDITALKLVRTKEHNEELKEMMQ